MGLNKKSVDDINVKGKRVLVRCDFNVHDYSKFLLIKNKARPNKAGP